MRRPDQEHALRALEKAIAALEDAQTHLAGDPSKAWQERYKTVVIATSKARWVHKGISKALKQAPAQGDAVSVPRTAE